MGKERHTKCTVDGCEGGGTSSHGREVFPTGLCGMHYRNMKKYGDIEYESLRMDMSRKSNVLYNSFIGMRNRCNNVNNHKYPRYGGRGIKVCDRWMNRRHGFENFLKDIGERPTVKHSIDRINNDGDYEPSNCRWATAQEQGANRGNNNKNVGVCYSERDKLWTSQLKANGSYYRKSFKLESEAIAYRKELEQLYL
jgi:hypothetical protein